MSKRCPCCYYYTIDSDDEIIVDICPVCFWQYDEVAQDKPDTMLGANTVTLNQARKNFKLFGASEKRFIGRVRKDRNN
jgi:hypothetical protein